MAVLCWRSYKRRRRGNTHTHTLWIRERDLASTSTFFVFFFFKWPFSKQHKKKGGKTLWHFRIVFCVVHIVVSLENSVLVPSAKQRNKWSNKTLPSFTVCVYLCGVWVCIYSTRCDKKNVRCVRDFSIWISRDSLRKKKRIWESWQNKKKTWKYTCRTHIILKARVLGV